MTGNASTPVVGLVAPTANEGNSGTASPFEVAIREATRKLAEAFDEAEAETSGAHPSKRPNRIRTRGPGKGKRAECVLLLDIAIQALQAAKERAIGVTADMPMHERVRLLVPVLSDAGLAMRSVEEAVERWEAGKV